MPRHRADRRPRDNMRLAQAVAMPGFLAQHKAHQTAREQHRRHGSRLDPVQADVETVKLPHGGRRPRSCPVFNLPRTRVARTMPVRTGAFRGDDAGRRVN